MRCSSPAFAPSIDVNRRLFLCLKSVSHRVSAIFRIYINLLMRVQLQLRVYPDWIMFVPTQNPWKGIHHGFEWCEGGHGVRAMACRSLIESGLWPRDAVERQMLQWGADYLDVNRNEATLPHLYVKINESLAWLNINSPSDINQSNGCLYPCCALYRQRHYNRQETFLLKGGVL